MVTFLETGLLNYFAIIFPALLVFAIVFALLDKTKILGENRGINAIIAIVLAFIVMLSANVAEVINLMAPWFVILFVFILLLLMVYKMMGASDQNLTNVITSYKGLQWTIAILGIIIAIAAIANVYGPKLTHLTDEGNETSEGFTSEVGETFFHPKVLGMLLIFLIAVFAIALLTRERI